MMEFIKRAVPAAIQSEPFELSIDAAGLCCALGYNLASASCALWANMDHFQESAFVTGSGDPVRVAKLPDKVLGPARLRNWIAHAVSDCARSMAEPAKLFDPKNTAILVLAPDTARPHSDTNLYAVLTLDVLGQFADGNRGPVYWGITVVSRGRAGLAEALRQSASLLTSSAKHVLLIGIDSYLNSADINTFLEAERLVVPDNTDGFLPGEAAAALVLSIAQPGADGLRVTGIGESDEIGRPDGSIPSRATGLTKAIRAACEQANIAPTDFAFRGSDQNGEQYYSREAANAITRLTFGGQRLPHLSIADKIGEVGAATGPSMLAWLWVSMPRGDYAIGSPGLVHLANDDGRRCAVVVQYQGEKHFGNARLRQR